MTTKEIRNKLDKCIKTMRTENVREACNEARRCQRTQLFATMANAVRELLSEVVAGLEQLPGTVEIQDDIEAGMYQWIPR